MLKLVCFLAQAPRNDDGGKQIDWSNLKTKMSLCSFKLILKRELKSAAALPFLIH